jgi:hypothetical protein
VHLAAELKLHEVARARPEVPAHLLEVPAELGGRQVRERVDREDRGVEAAAEVEVGHVREDDLAVSAEPRAGELDHRRRAVDPDHLSAAPRQCRGTRPDPQPGSRTLRQSGPSRSRSQSTSDSMSQSNARS